SDAHSWVEVFFPGNGWIVFDPTPPAPETRAGLFSRLNQYLDWMELTWNEWVISYDFAHQIVLAQNLQRGSRSWGDALRSEMDRWRRRSVNVVKRWQFHHESLAFLIPMGLLGILAMLRFGIVGKIVRRLRLLFQSGGKSSAAQTQFASLLYAELMRLFNRYGLRRSETQTPLEFAAAVTEPTVAPALREFTDIYAQARFGGAPLDAVRL